MDQGPFGEDTSMWAKGYLYSRALTIGGGTSEVQRNILAERILGLASSRCYCLFISTATRLRQTSRIRRTRTTYS